MLGILAKTSTAAAGAPAPSGATAVPPPPPKLELDQWKSPFAGLTDEEAADLGRRMGGLPRLKRADLCRAGMADSQLCALCASLGQPSALAHLRVLMLDFNGFGDAGLCALAAALGSGAMARVQHLGLTANEIYDAGIALVIRALEAPLGAPH